jgi:hypothetical protein
MCKSRHKKYEKKGNVNPLPVNHSTIMDANDNEGDEFPKNSKA